MFLKSFMLCAALALISPLTFAQEQSGAKKSFDNYDIAPKSVVQAEKNAEKPKEKAPEKNADQAKDKTVQKEQVAEKAPEKAPEKNASTPQATDQYTTTSKSKKSARATAKSAVLKTIVPKHKGEGYWQDEPVANTEPAAPPPPPKIYSEVRTSITENGRLMLTSDTVVVKPAVATKIVPVATLTESTGDEKLDGIIQEAARKNKVDPRLILEVIRQESGFRTGAVSPKGARGLMQLIPSTAARFGVTNIFDREQNVHAGTRYLKFLLDTFNGDVDLALAGYNAGENAVMRYNYQVPPYRETRDYVRSITARYRSRYHQIITVEKVEPIVVRQVPLATFAAENGRVILSNNY